MKVRVVCYEGYKAEETPRAFLLGERRVEVMRSWTVPGTSGGSR